MATGTEERDVTQVPNSQPELPSTYIFSARELARLTVYRAAVVARFYTDQCEQPSVRTEIESLRLLDSIRTNARAA